MQEFFRILKQPSLRVSLGRESWITAGTYSQVMRSLKAEGKDFFDALPSAESLCSAVALGANSAWGLGAPSDGGTLALADRALLDSVALFCLKWWDRAILDLDLNEQTCPFCYNAATNPISSQWAVFAFWENTSLTEQTRLLELCSSTASNVTSLAVCGDRNWTSETTG